MSQAKFVNTLPYISNPVEEFADYKFVSREEKIYPVLIGDKIPERESKFFAELIIKKQVKSLLDLGVGSGIHLRHLLQYLSKEAYKLDHIEANEVNGSFIMEAQKQFYNSNQRVLIHKANWLDLPKATPPYTMQFDLAYLTWNSLTYIWGGSRLYTKLAQKSIINKFAELIKPWWYFLIDTRDYDYIKSLMLLHPSEIMQAYNFEKKVHYYGTDKEIVVFPAYISDTVVVLHYYDKKEHIRSKQEYFPVYHNDLVETLSDLFEIEEIYYDYEVVPTQKCMLRQYLARKK